ncbi:collagen alpha-1(I) chain-like [Malaclemys terrapin pileata]|uniref:collagen alpha-1(I) chain-like n=1 Tax=Malaclemys terrapin pileata TaxID=2991368 RepID=UPI0023A83AF7|nr:collagen alpha-1(I) chain-like [Malaclemys terrapin pileata]
MAGVGEPRPPGPRLLGSPGPGRSERGAGPAVPPVRSGSPGRAGLGAASLSASPGLRLLRVRRSAPLRAARSQRPPPALSRDFAPPPPGRGRGGGSRRIAQWKSLRHSHYTVFIILSM